MTICRHCQKEKEDRCFYPKILTGENRMKWCKDCFNEMGRAQRAEYRRQGLCQCSRPLPKGKKVCAKCYVRNHQYQHGAMLRRRNQRIKSEVIERYGGKCACCDEGNIGFLSIDHIANNGTIHRKQHGIIRGGAVFYYWLRRNQYPKGFQVLCFNCNLGKAQSVEKRCPHVIG